ncbi:fungal-specific transcription factor domain-containing protein [Cercophora newfieldiana]|uniref:Fungal-specific transcription factor domain-containing protein n=1 Tax=Cercophora newfieldiana TaxID=92897 RepID=A0AA39Y933_9PEZI|nr:fungal-specific transcription factor domain-containing protein [Cercophora newfieldiana]
MDQHDPEIAPELQTGAQEPPRKRARLSCNACKARKTKHCRSLGIPCEADLRSRKRPFYRVSGEVYEYSIKLLRRFVPEEQLPELTVENIQSLLQRLETERGGAENVLPNLPAVTLPTPVLPTPALPAAHAHGTTNDAAGPAPAPAAAAQGSSHEVMEPDEHPLLQEELGCMLLDSMGKYRYVGADSSIRWNHAVRMARDTTSSSRANSKIISPLKTGLLPPTTPESPRGGGGGNRRGEMYLPSRQLCMAYASRFFDQIHCMYWFFSSEQFYTRLDQALEDRGTTASASWLCALYSVFAMGSIRPGGGDPQDSKTSLDYLSMARELSTGAADEADIDSIKAFGLLGLATHATCFSVTAYLHLGTAVRIGFSLGLHRDVSLRSKDSLEREWGRRLWWTIYILDHEMASRFGYPCTIVDDAIFMRTPPATEQILDPGPNTPLGYQALLVALVQLRKRISHDCFLSPANVGGRLPISRVTSCLSALRSWADSIPMHLRADSSLHPQHRRAVGLLHLRYWTSVISLTRPFLLFTISPRSSTTSTTRNSNSNDGALPAKKQLYEQLSTTCIEAAEAAVHILRRMRDEKTLSSLMLLDCHCIGEVTWILILALQKHGVSMERQEMLRLCLETLRGMERIGWCEKVTPEFEARVNESGVLSEEGQPGAGESGNGQHQRLEHPQVSMPSCLLTFPRNLDGMQFDVFEALDFANGGRLGRMDMDMFMDASFSGSQFLFDNLDGVHPP